MLARVRAVVIGTLTATIVAYVLKPFLEWELKQAPTEAQVIATIAGVMVVAFVLVAIDFGVEQFYARNARLRKKLDWLMFHPFLEGYWVDVGIDCSWAADKIVNYSFISIIRRGGAYEIHGMTWNVFGEFEFNWESIYVNHSGNSLRFWYSGTGASSRRVDEAIAKFKFGGVLAPDRYSGRYESAFRTEARRLMDTEFLERWNKDLPEEQRKAEAEANLKCFMKEQNFDECTCIQKNIMQKGRDAREPYFTFLRRSENKKAEISIVEDAVEHIPRDRPDNSVLDIGPGDGKLTSIVLRALHPQPFKYTAVEPVGCYLDDVEKTLAPFNQAPSAQERFRFLKQHIESFMETASPNQFGLVLAFNSLYFVSGLDQVCSHIKNVLDRYGILIALHTDIRLVPFLDDLLSWVNPLVNRDVVQKIENLAGSGLLSKVIDPIERISTLEFPMLDDVGWERVRKPNLPFRDRETEDVINLISFLVNVPLVELYEKKDWGKVAYAVEQHVRKNDSKLHLPMKLQILQK